jgi:hypothetical protein
MKDPSPSEYQQRAVEQRLQEMDAEIDRQRALELRLQEMDAEINRQTTPLRPTSKYRNSKKSSNILQNLSAITKVAGLFILGLVAVCVFQWFICIAFLVFVGKITWMILNSR